MKNYAHQSAIITGGASGLGFAAARRLATAGVEVAIFDLNEEFGKKAMEEIGAVFCHVNITFEAEVKAGFEKTCDANGQERILVNCAGKGSAIKTVTRDRKTGEIKRHSMEANTILPGIFDTPPLARLSDKIRDNLNVSVPFPRHMGQPDEYAGLAETLIRNTYFNGQTIHLDGAIRMTPR